MRSNRKTVLAISLLGTVLLLRGALAYPLTSATQSFLQSHPASKAKVIGDRIRALYGGPLASDSDAATTTDQFVGWPSPGLLPQSFLFGNKDAFGVTGDRSGKRTGTFHGHDEVPRPRVPTDGTYHSVRTRAKGEIVCPGRYRLASPQRLQTGSRTPGPGDVGGWQRKKNRRRGTTMGSAGA